MTKQIKKSVRVAICKQDYVISTKFKFEEGNAYKFEKDLNAQEHPWSETTYRIFTNIKIDKGYSLVIGKSMFDRHFRIFA